MAKPKSDLDVLAKLAQAKFRGVPFDVVSMDQDISHDHAVHKFPDRDAGIVEATGRNPVVYSFNVLFRNGVAGWTDQPYPGQWRKFTAACADRSTGPLVHPELGEIKVKCQSCKTSWSPDRRDGVDVQVSFIEANGLEDDLLTQLEKIGSTPYSAARDLDNAIGAMNPAPEVPDSLKPSLLDSLKKLSGALAMFKLGIGNVISQIDGYAQAVGDLRDQIAGIDNPANYQALQAADRLFAAMLDLGATVASKARPTTLAVVPFDTSVSAVAGFFGNSLDDFLKLNPALGSKPGVRRNTTVLVYVG